MVETNTALKSLRNTVTNTSSTVYSDVKSIVLSPVDTVKRTGALINDLPNLPLVNNISIADLKNFVTEPSKSDLTKFIEKSTNLSFSSLSKQNLLNQFQDGLGSLQSILVGELRNCIDRHLRNIARDIKFVDIALNFDRILGRKIGEVRSKINNKVNSEYEKLLYNKLKIQRRALIRQKVTDSIRKICPDASASRLKKYQTSPDYREIETQRAALNTAQTVNNQLVASVNTPVNNNTWKNLV